MKQGAHIDKSEFVQPWIILLLNFAMDNADREESEGSFKPLNMGIGWMIDETQKDNRQKGSCQRSS